MPRFVVLRHEPDSFGGKPLHWDFMLEVGDTLRTWSLVSEPQVHLKIDAEQLAEHRLAYLDYEGVVSGGRGIVRRWDHGSYDPLSQAEEIIRVRLRGQRLTGEVTLERHPSENQRWIFMFEAPGDVR